MSMKAQTNLDGPVSAVFFDKDGTLFQFADTWDVWAAEQLKRLSAGDSQRLKDLAKSIDYDLDRQRFLPTSVAIAGTNMEVAECFAQVLHDQSASDIERELSEQAQSVMPSQVVELAPFIDDLRQQGFLIGLITNDSEQAARAQLMTCHCVDKFDFIAGYDSGYGAKPSAEPLLHAARKLNVDPQKCIMVGDSAHDLIAAKNAGMKAIGVLTGLAKEKELALIADAVLPSIAGLSEWIDKNS